MRSIAQWQIERAQERDFHVEAYRYIYFTRDIEAQITHALETIVPYNIKRLWIDAEDDEHELSVAQLENLLHWARYFVENAGLQTGIYTGRGWWRKFMMISNWEESQMFSDLPLWNAWYGVPPGSYIMFGGWKAPLIHQYEGTVDLCDVGTDYNVWLG